MFKNIVLPALFAALTATATPIAKRQDSGDVTVLNFALILEHLESTFYSQALSQFSAEDFTDAGYESDVRSNIAVIAADEAQHVQFLSSALTAAGATPVSACNYTFPYDGVTGFLGLSQILEGVGVSAYLGAAPLISTDAYLTAAGSILTAEARHSAYIRYVNGYSPFTSFDTPLDPKSIQSLATPFFASCPNGSAPTFGMYPSANLTSSVTLPGSTINVAFEGSAEQTGLYCIFFSGVMNSVAPYMNGSCTIPTANATRGQAYGVISNSETFSDSAVVAGPFILQFDRMNATSSSNSTSNNDNDSD